MKALYFNEKKSIEANYNNGPNCVSPDQWRALVNNWTSQKAKVHSHFFIVYIFPYQISFSTKLQDMRTNFSIYSL
jgi:hypothetical protein